MLIKSSLAGDCEGCSVIVDGNLLSYESLYLPFLPENAFEFFSIETDSDVDITHVSLRGASIQKVHPNAFSKAGNYNDDINLFHKAEVLTLDHENYLTSLPTGLLKEEVFPSLHFLEARFMTLQEINPDLFDGEFEDLNFRFNGNKDLIFDPVHRLLDTTVELTLQGTLFSEFYDNFQQRLDQVGKTPFPSLEKLHVGNEDQTEFPNDFFNEQNFPELKELHLFGDSGKSVEGTFKFTFCDKLEVLQLNQEIKSCIPTNVTSQ
eukprot:snap_masked-scaffold_48-processed-gene-1.95-mRNA-1 protein AED:1.00 eAED:1.00 QI:0/-1/0/0/-1/1/1/0/262